MNLSVLCTVTMSDVPLIHVYDNELINIQIFRDPKLVSLYVKRHDVSRVTMGDRRWSRKQKGDRWLPQVEERMCSLSDEYKTEPLDSSKHFWVEQAIYPANYAELLETPMSPGKKELAIRLACVTSVFNEEEFCKLLAS